MLNWTEPAAEEGKASMSRKMSVVHDEGQDRLRDEL